jgi:hypothetical protein
MSHSNQLNSLYLNPTSSSETEEEMNKIQHSKATGPYSIPVNVLKLLKEYISKPLGNMFNISLSSGSVLAYFKIANVYNSSA